MAKKSLQRGLVLLFGTAFVGSTVFMLVGSFWRRPSTPIADSNLPTEAPAVNSRDNLTARLETQAIGYEKLLEKEPENTTILTNLVQIRLQMGDLEGAVDPLTKLVQLQPERTELATILNQIQARLAESESASE
ncbi:MAG: tetratricopeptide repeat protein [Xenococcaceae cyanobacterium MO_207.B15]|nr:tetratricopeptide repeat protein [Xenococcaceae cyanobacterium MO_207.B15]MDJ0745878.1 tetratricopeptide repeat protein [Xenococcaceae cyanobacterium MO_167.B27]